MPPKDGSNSEKLYRFISDPGHKETLSGRVRVACVTCRRKKIKCSGDVPCSTCQEKGLICEGVIERKRPKTDPDRQLSVSSTRGERRSSHDTPSDDGLVSSKRNSFDLSSKIDHGENVLRRPTAHLQELGAENSFDSGYGSGGQSKQDVPTSQTQQPDAIFPFNYNLSSRDNYSADYAHDAHPSPTARQSWGPVPQPASTGVTTRDIAGFELNKGGSETPAAMFPTSMHWQDPGNPSNLWEDDCTSDEAATKLISAAEVLEERAMSLRRLASRRRTEFVDETGRQTLMAEVYPSGTVPLGLRTDPSSGLRDDPSLRPEESGSASGLTPILQNFSPWWDVEQGLPSPHQYQQSTNNPSVVSSTDAIWSYAPGSYDTQSIDTVYHEQNNETNRKRPSTTFLDTGQPTQSHRAQLKNQHGRLYPWPE